MNYDQLKEDLYWQLRPLMLNYGIHEDCTYLSSLISQAYSEGEAEGIMEGYEIAKREYS